ncbi:MAG: hypothetical protein LBR54_01905, partial [Oscillospiraceae bacterium]|nr:hypothetical protein [Oscillospiraceae bacterium]
SYPGNQKTIVKLSNYLYDASGHYKRILSYFADLSTFAWDINVSVKNEREIDFALLKKKYEDLGFALDKMNLPHELGKIMHTLLREGVYYGYAYEDGKDFFFAKLDINACRSRNIEDGVHNVEVNLGHINESNLGTFPPEIRQVWRDYIENNGNLPHNLNANGGIWYELDSKKSVCIRMDETVCTAVPLFIYLFPDIMAVDDIKELAKKRAEMENYRIIAMKIPLKKDANEVNDFAVGNDIVLENISTAAAVTDQNIALFPTALVPEAINFDQKTNDFNNVKNSIDELNSNAGINGNIFNGGNSASLMISVENDSSIIYRIHRQMERWINRRIKLFSYNSKNFRFKLHFLPITVYNREKVVDRCLKMCQAGLPYKTKLGAALGMSPCELQGADYLENSVLNLGSRWRVLGSSFTQKSGEGGRPPVNDEDLSERGAQTREGGYNDADLRNY